VARYRDPKSGEAFYRPLGGAIVFGERGGECIVREVREELGAEITDLTYLGTIENIFTYDGKPAHEIVLVYEAAFCDQGQYEVGRTTCRDNGEEFEAVWKPLDDFRKGTSILYPEGLLELLDGTWNQAHVSTVHSWRERGKERGNWAKCRVHHSSSLCCW